MNKLNTSVYHKEEAWLGLKGTRRRADDDMTSSGSQEDLAYSRWCEEIRSGVENNRRKEELKICR